LADDQTQQPGTIGPTRLPALAVAFVLGLLLGYAVVPVAELLDQTAPQVQWSAVGALVIIAGVVGVFAWSTYRTVHSLRQRMDAQRAVNFLMLAKASALVGAFVAGGYLGFGVNFLDDLDIALPRERALRSLAAAVAGLAIVVAGLLLERACRVPNDDDPAPPTPPRRQ
jgi:hypothetical protein